MIVWMRPGSHVERLAQVTFEQPENFSPMDASTPPPRVVLADDKKEVLQTVTLILGSRFSIVGTAENGRDAVNLAINLFPDVVVLDISMPIMNGIQAARRLKELRSPARVVFLTVQADPDFVQAALSVGALGYVLKESLATDLALAIGEVMQGNIFTSPSLPLH
jgi:DNA-binding NarL/FixJ family response regulator